MTAALSATTLGELDELLADLPVIDLYRLPHESLPRPSGLPHQSLVPRDPGQPPAIPGTTVALGILGAVAGALIAVWAVTAVIGVGTWFPWWLVEVIPLIWVAIRRARRHGE